MDNAGLDQPLAHIDEGGRPHPLVEHLREVARRAARFAAKLDAEEHGYLAGLWHDLGKYSGDFQHMIRTENGFDSHIEVEGGPRDHSSAGAAQALRVLGPRGMALAFVIAGHHAGLADQPQLKQRLEAKRRLLDDLLKREIPTEILSPPLPSAPEWAAPDTARRFELWIRMLFSALCDADFLDTEQFLNPLRAEARAIFDDVATLQPRLEAHLSRLNDGAPESAVNRARKDVHQACLHAAALEPGMFSLTVPTGGGKTLASLRFALEHAVNHRLERVIVAIPYTSILEQTVDVYREALGKDSVVEHHSALDPERETLHSRVASENWDAPVVVTTTVQLFESLFASRSSACRKLHNLARSVIVLDEAQALPGRLLPPILDALEDLTHHYRASVVISTATQPALDLKEVREICGPELKLFERLKRVDVRWPTSKEPTTYQALAAEIATTNSCLAVVHRRDDARALSQLVDDGLGNPSTYHLSALMTPAHRARTLSKIKQEQRAGRAVRVVSTQLVEAGVDLDFPIVFRAFAGFDSLAQAAGRCNREGRLASGELRIFHAPTEPPQGVPRTARDVARSMLLAGGALELFSPEAQREYFAKLYEHTDLAKGTEIQSKRAALMFREVAGAFRLIDDGWARPLTIAHDDEICRRVALLRDRGPSRDLYRGLQRYTINVPRQMLERWQRAGIVTDVGGVAVLEGGYLRGYDERFGLVPEHVGALEPSDLIVG